MATITGQIKSFDQKLMKEDISDIIYNISPTDTPFMSSCKKGSCKNTKFQWNLDKLSDAAVPVGIAEGASSGLGVVEVVIQEESYTQIFRKEIEVTGTIEAVDLYGRKSEMAYQMAKKSQELKRDIEKTLLNFSNSNAPNQLRTGYQESTSGKIAQATDARVTRNFANIIDTHKFTDMTSPATRNLTSTVIDADPAGALGIGTGLIGPTPPILTPAILDGAMQRMWAIGTDFDYAIVSPMTMSLIATFAFNSTGRMRDIGQQRKVVNVVDIYVSAFGEISFALDRFMAPGNATSGSSAGNQIYFIDPKQLELKYLRNFQTTTVAKTGDSDKKYVLGEMGLAVKAPQSCGILYNFKHSA